VDDESSNNGQEPHRALFSAPMLLDKGDALICRTPQGIGNSAASNREDRISLLVPNCIRSKLAVVI